MSKLADLADLEAAAAFWLLRKADGLGDHQQAEFQAWLDESPEHRLAYWRLEYGWDQASRLSALRGPDTLTETVSGGGRSGARWPRVARGRILAMAASLVFAIGLGAALWPRATVFETETGERRQVTLEDGSRLDLNTQTRLRTTMSEDVRQAWLDEGEAYFSIAHDPDRPFVLHMGQRTVRVLGTRFIARRHGDVVSVTVAEGRVSVASSRDHTDAPLILTAGDVVSTDGPSLLQHHESSESIDDALAWRGGRLVFDQVSLGNVAAEFNRYNETQIEIADDRTRAVRIGGSFEANNVDAFARLLGSAYGLHVERDGETIIISE